MHVNCEYILRPLRPAAPCPRQVLFSYVQEDEEDGASGGQAGSRCNARWLLEYGFTIADGHPGRDCHTLNITAAAVLELMGHSGLPLDAQQELASELLVAGGCDSVDSCWHVVQLDGHGLVPRPAFEWLTQGLGGDDNLAEQVLALLLLQELQVLREVLQQEELLLVEGWQGDEGGADVGMAVGGCDGLREELLGVLRGSAQALSATLHSMGYADDTQQSLSER
jgi:hypothetical protein